MIKQKYNQIKRFLIKHEQRLFIVGLFVGFVWDNLTLKRIDLLFENLVILFYLLVIGTSITLIYMLQSARRVPKFLESIAWALPFVLQIGFGALFSAFVVFYVRGSAFTVSWIFLLILAGLLVGNEFFRTRYYRLPFQLSVFFVALLSYLIFSIPVLVNSISVWVFLLSIASGLALIALFVYLLLKVSKTPGKQHIKSIQKSIGSITIIILILYFTNIIPPLPLSLKNTEVAHSISRTGDTYTVETEKYKWYEPTHYFKTTYNRTNGEPVFVFSSVFAPTNLDTQILHHWQFKSDGKWVSSDKISFQVSGGRDGGYRGWSTKTSLEAGKWRVDVITPRGQIIGRQTFTIKNADEPQTTQLENF